MTGFRGIWRVVVVRDYRMTFHLTTRISTYYASDTDAKSIADLKYKTLKRRKASKKIFDPNGILNPGKMFV